MCTILHSKLNQMPTDADVLWFFARFSFFLRGPIFPFGLGALSLCVGTALMIYMLFGHPAVVIFSALVFLVFVALVIQQFRMSRSVAGRMSKRVQDAIDSLNAKEMMGSDPGGNAGSNTNSGSLDV